MGLPRRRQQRLHNASAAACAGYREILGRDYIQHTERELSAKLLGYLEQAEPSMRVTDARNPEEVTEVYEIRTLGGVRFAVVRGRMVVTMLREHAVKTNLCSTWTRLDVPTELVAETLEQVERVLAEPPPPSPIKLVPVEPPAEATAPADVPIDTVLGDAEVRAAIRVGEAARDVARRRETATRLEAELARIQEELGSARLNFDRAEKQQARAMADLERAVRGLPPEN